MQPHGGGLAQPQGVGRVIHLHAHFIDEAGAQLGRLHLPGREFGHGGDVAHRAAQGLIRLAVGRDGGGHAGGHAAQIRLGHIHAHPLGLGERQRVDGPLGTGHVARLQQARAHHGADGRAQCALLNLMLQQGQRGLGSFQLRAGGGNVFLARANLRQPQRLLRLADFGLGHLRGGLRVLQRLAAGRAAASQLAQPGQVLPRPGGIGAGGGHAALRLRHLLRARAAFQLAQALALRLDLRARLRSLQSQRLRVQHGQRLPGLHARAFVHGHFQHAAGAFKRQRNLPDVHIAVQRERAIARPALRAGGKRQRRPANGQP